MATKSTKKSERPPPPHPFGVDYAPTGRAACKKCMSVIGDGTVRFYRRVWSRFHDGFDVNYYHLRCGLIYIQNDDISVLNGYQSLKWEDILKLTAKFNLKIDENDEKIKEYKLYNKLLWDLIEPLKELKKDFLFLILDINLYFYKAHKLKPLEAAYRIADGLIFGRMPICPQCNTRSLLQRGGQISCTGYISTTIHCTYTHNQFSLFDHSQNSSIYLQRDGPLHLPIEVNQMPFFKKWKPSNNFPSITHYKKAYIIGTKNSEDNEKFDEISNKDIKKINFDSEDELDIKEGNELLGMKFSAISLNNITKKQLTDIIVSHNGQFTNNVDIQTNYLLTSDFEASKSTQNYKSAILLGVPILHNSFITCILNKDVKTAKCTQKAAFKLLTSDVDTLDISDMPKGIILRQRKHAIYFKLDGKLTKKIGRVSDLLVKKKRENDLVKIEKRPQIMPNSALLNVDPLFSTKKTAKIFVDENNNAYNCSTNFTDIQTGINKFYNLQLIYISNTQKPTFHVFRKWGRIGDDKAASNRHTSDKFGYKKDDAISFFNKKFTELTNLKWEERYTQKQQIGRYAFVELEGYIYNEYIPIKKQHLSNIQDIKKEENNEEICTLNEKLQSLIKMIFDSEMMEKELLEENFNISRMPLGSISRNTILDGYSILSQIQTILLENKHSSYNTYINIHQTRDGLKVDNEFDEEVNKELMVLSNKFYTVIPHIFDKNILPPILNNFEKLHKKCEMIEQLVDISAAYKIMKEVKYVKKHVLDVQYEKLQCDIHVLDTHNQQFTHIYNMIKNTHASTHTDYSLQIIQIFTVHTHQPSTHHQIQNKKLLWHGSKMSNWAGILSTGLQIAPPEAPSTGYMFGKGLYFADMVSKSANYCFSSPEQPFGLLLLCEVSLGNQLMKLEADYEADIKANKLGKHSTWGVGKSQPDPLQQIVVISEDGEDIYLSCGNQIDNIDNIKLAEAQGCEGETPTLLYNEFIVYDKSQVKIRYLIKVKFEFNSLELDED